MKSSSAKQQPEFDFADSTGDLSHSGEPQGRSSSTSEVRFASLQGDASAIATAARRAGRLNAASISDDEINELLKERRELLDKKFANTITQRELNRLTYVRWSLDTIEDARSGPQLDVLQALVAQYEAFHRDLEELRDDLVRETRRRK
jgi:hypothetical protein